MKKKRRKNRFSQYSPQGIGLLLVVFVVVAAFYSVFLRHEQTNQISEPETEEPQDFEETQVTVEENSYDSIVIKVPYDEIAVGSTFEVVESPSQENLYEIRIDELTIAEITFVSSEENAIQFDGDHLYVHRRIPKTSGGMQDELWKYNQEGSGVKLFSTSGLRYQIQQDQDLIMIRPGEDQVILVTNKNGALVQSIDVATLLNPVEEETNEDATESAETKKRTGNVSEVQWQGQSSLLITVETFKGTEQFSFDTSTGLVETVD